MPPEGAASMIAAAVDFGGTKVAVGFIDGTGRVLESRRFATPETPEEVARIGADTLREIAGRLSLDLGSVGGVGATVPGPADTVNGVLRFAPAQGWRDVPFAAMLSQAVGLPAFIANDVNACALAEQRFGVAKDAENLLWVTVSTGIGGALLLNGRLYEGARAMAGEIGHVSVARSGARCGCGRIGCVQAMASGTAVRAMAVARGLAAADARAVFDLARAGDPEALEIIAAAHAHIGLAMSYAVNLLDLDMVVVGGGMAESLDIARLEAEILAHAMTLPEHTPPVLRTALGTEAALIGAGVLVLSRMEDVSR
jgi:glucokinase